MIFVCDKSIVYPLPILMTSLICLHLLLCSGAFFVPLKRIVVDLAIRLPFPLSAYWGPHNYSTTPHCIGRWLMTDDDDDDDDWQRWTHTHTHCWWWWPVLLTSVFWVVDDSRAHVHLRWKTTKRAISFTVPGTFCKTDVREYNTLFTLSENYFFIWISLKQYKKWNIPHIVPHSKYYNTLLDFSFQRALFQNYR